MTPKELIEQLKIPRLQLESALRRGGYSGERTILNNRLDKDCIIAYKKFNEMGVIFLMIEKTKNKSGYGQMIFVYSIINPRFMNRGGNASSMARLSESDIAKIEDLTIVDEKGWEFFKALQLCNKIEGEQQ